MIRAPSPVTSAHDVAGFACGRPAFDEWLQWRALPSQDGETSRTYVITNDMRVIGYYALASGCVSAAEIPGKITRHLPDPIPVMTLGRMAVDRSWQAQGLGRALLRDAVLRAMQAAEIGSLRVLLLQAIDEPAASFYRRAGFLASAIRPLTLLLPLDPRLYGAAFIGRNDRPMHCPTESLHL